MSAQPPSRRETTTLDDRRAVRREQLMEVGEEIVGTKGAGDLTVRGVCRAAGLSERYFYESFPDRESLLLAVHERAEQQARERILEALTSADSRDQAIRAVVEAFVGFFEEDPGRSRILLQEPLVQPALARAWRRSLTTLAAILAGLIAGEGDDPEGPEMRLTAVALAGGLTGMYLGYLRQAIEAEPGQIVDRGVDLIERSIGGTPSS
ncbi:MAG: TetR/AcrR family transcriptional regulator [Solirubrobacterales bacterium]|nr:TetR/AcrR family transcriptional regulator [Solirubrobacterales bacterium]